MERQKKRDQTDYYYQVHHPGRIHSSYYLYYTRRKARQKLHIAELIGDLLGIAYGIGAEKQAKEAGGKLKGRLK